MALWHLRGLRRGAGPHLLSNTTAAALGIAPDAKTRALLKLEAAGLVAVERRGKRSPRVTLLLPAAQVEELNA